MADSSPATKSPSSVKDATTSHRLRRICTNDQSVTIYTRRISRVAKDSNLPCPAQLSVVSRRAPLDSRLRPAPDSSLGEPIEPRGTRPTHQCHLVSQVTGEQRLELGSGVRRAHVRL